MRLTRGFTLVELMIVVAIIGILGAIGYPSYQNYVREARRTDGKGALLSMANEQEKFFLANRRYSAVTAEVWSNGVASLEGFYTVLAVSGDGTSFLVRATAVGAQAGDVDCAVFELNQAGQKVARDSGGNDNSAACW